MQTGNPCSIFIKFQAVFLSTLLFASLRSHFFVYSSCRKGKARMNYDPQRLRNHKYEPNGKENEGLSISLIWPGRAICWIWLTVVQLMLWTHLITMDVMAKLSSANTKVLTEYRWVYPHQNRWTFIAPTLLTHYKKTIHLKILLDLTPYHSIMHSALLIITLQGHLVFQLGTRLHESGNALASAGVLNLLLPSSFLSFLPPGQNKNKCICTHSFP